MRWTKESRLNKKASKRRKVKSMKVMDCIKEMKEQGQADFFVVYANIGNNADELVYCEPCEAVDCEVYDIQYHKNNCGITAVITAEMI